MLLTPTGSASEMQCQHLLHTPQAESLENGLTMVVPACFKPHSGVLGLFLSTDKTQLRKMVGALGAEQMLRNHRHLPSNPSQNMAPLHMPPTPAVHATAQTLLYNLLHLRSSPATQPWYKGFHCIVSPSNGYLQSRASQRKGKSRRLLLQPISERKNNHLGAKHLSASWRNTRTLPHFDIGWLNTPQTCNVGLLQSFHQVLSLN